MSIKWGNGSSNVRTLGMLSAADGATKGAAAVEAGDAANDGEAVATDIGSSLSEGAEVETGAG